MIQPALNLTEAQGTHLAMLAARLQNRETLPPLVPTGPWHEALEALMLDFSDSDILGSESFDPIYAKAVRSGLLLWNDSMTESHTVSQDIHNSTGSYWHGILHRREPDFPNAKYWFRQVGDHPIFPQVRDQAVGVFQTRADTSEYAQSRLNELNGKEGWDPFAFVDWCEEAHRGEVTDPMAKELLEAIQLREMELLLTYSYRQAVGEKG